MITCVFCTEFQFLRVDFLLERFQLTESYAKNPKKTAAECRLIAAESVDFPRRRRKKNQRAGCFFTRAHYVQKKSGN